MKIYLAVIIAFSFLNIFNVCIIRESLGSQIIPINSCVNLHTKKIKIQRIAEYETLENRAVNAVILITKTGVKVCVPRDRIWVKKTIDYLDQKAKSGKSRTITRPQITNA